MASASAAAAATVVENHKVVLMEHELVVDGVLLRETKQLTTVTSDDGRGAPEECVLVHTRSIGDKQYRVKEVRLGGKVRNACVETDLNSQEVAAFKKEWRSLWEPVITDEQAAASAAPTLQIVHD